MVVELLGIKSIMQIQQEKNDCTIYKKPAREDKIMNQMILKEYFDPFNIEKKQKQKLF